MFDPRDDARNRDGRERFHSAHVSSTICCRRPNARPRTSDVDRGEYVTPSTSSTTSLPTDRQRES